jgi:ubiquinone/menaquinone biosynthesis C-methylase UbiE
MEKRIANEIKHGKFLASQGAGEIWNWESPAGKIRWKRRVAMLTETLKPGHLVLEIGCGTGYFTVEILKSGSEVKAIDISPELLALARKELAGARVTFHEEDAHNLSFPDDYFDRIIGSSVLHHLDIQKALSEIFRVLKPGGRIAFTEPNMANPQIALQKNIPWLKRKLGDSPDETAFFRFEIQKLVKKNGFRQICVKPFDFLHPAIPVRWIAGVSALGSFLEKTPLIREFAGSLFITGVK